MKIHSGPAISWHKNKPAELSCVDGCVKVMAATVWRVQSMAREIWFYPVMVCGLGLYHRPKLSLCQEAVVTYLNAYMSGRRAAGLRFFLSDQSNIIQIAGRLRHVEQVDKIPIRTPSQAHFRPISGLHATKK
ncbi:hypothetical protein VTJ04DRAFT_10106 [Mycothermus thermophilus]|uniref:uncharacterized protein n=1 Tax=Humicola insolens TaxID=85995 RepID=UPI003742FE46